MPDPIPRRPESSPNQCPRCPAKLAYLIEGGVPFLKGHKRFVCGTRESPDGADVFEGRDCLVWQMGELRKENAKLRG